MVGVEVARRGREEESSRVRRGGGTEGGVSGSSVVERSCRHRKGSDLVDSEGVGVFADDELVVGSEPVPEGQSSRSSLRSVLKVAIHEVSLLLWSRLGDVEVGPLVGRLGIEGFQNRRFVGLVAALPPSVVVDFPSSSLPVWEELLHTDKRSSSDDFSWCGGWEDEGSRGRRWRDEEGDRLSGGGGGGGRGGRVVVGCGWPESEIEDGCESSVVEEDGRWLEDVEFRMK